MAPITKTLALAGALFAACGFAAPVEKRAVVWVTVTDVVWTTVDVTTTIYPEQLGATTATVEPVTTTPAAPAVPTTTVAPPQETETQSQQQAAAPQPETSAPAPAPAPQPETTTAPAPAPAPQPTEQTTVLPQPTTTSQAPAPAAPTSASTAHVSTSSSGYNGACDESSPCVGQMTFYDTATSASAPSACGTTNDGQTELVLALPIGMMTDADCGKTVTIEYNGVTQTGKVVDKCVGCDNTSIDLSRALFESFASLGAGRIYGAKWYIN